MIPIEPRIRVSAILRWKGSVLLCRHEKPGKEYWLLPGGGVNSGESLVDALHRELGEEIGIDDQLPVEGPVAIVDSIAPARGFAPKHVVHIIFAGDLGGRSLEAVTSRDAAVRGHRWPDYPNRVARTGTFPIERPGRLRFLYRQKVVHAAMRVLVVSPRSPKRVCMPTRSAS